MKAEEISKVSSLFNVGELFSFKELSGGYANQNFFLKTSSGDYVLRECVQQPKALLQYELDLMHILRENDFPTAYPISNGTDEFIICLERSTFMLYEYKTGSEPTISVKTAAEMGSAIGFLSTIQNFETLPPKRNTLDFFFIDQLIRQFEESKNPIDDVFDFVLVYANKLRSVAKQNLPKGLIHGDAFPNNTVFGVNDDLIAIIDFEEACVDNLILDVGMTINGFCFVDNRLDEQLLEAFLSAYTSYRKIDEGEQKTLFSFIQVAAFTMLCWHLRFDLVNTPNNTQELRVRELMNRIYELEKCNWINQKIAFINK
ncbi:MAG: homoserine kinase [Ekhidna sp.]|nr:homoserine kinase [Ekhidna sp.]